MNNNSEYKLILSNRKSISIEITADLSVVVRAPIKMNTREIGAFVAAHRLWIEKHLELQRVRQQNTVPEPTELQAAEFKKRANDILPQKVAYYAQIMGVEPKGIKITSARKRLGSCSSQNTLCFSFRVMMYDEEVIDYVVMHELAHIKEHNHSKRFYDLLEKYCPSRKQIENKIRKGE